MQDLAIMVLLRDVALCLEQVFFSDKNKGINTIWFIKKKLLVSHN